MTTVVETIRVVFVIAFSPAAAGLDAAVRVECGNARLQGEDRQD